MHYLLSQYSLDVLYPSSAHDTVSNIYFCLLCLVPFGRIEHVLLEVRFMDSTPPFPVPRTSAVLLVLGGCLHEGNFPVYR